MHDAGDGGLYYSQGGDYLYLPAPELGRGMINEEG